jgi:hypothetical protein
MLSTLRIQIVVDLVITRKTSLQKSYVVAALRMPVLPSNTMHYVQYIVDPNCCRFGYHKRNKFTEVLCHGGITDTGSDTKNILHDA